MGFVVVFFDNSLSVSRVCISVDAWCGCRQHALEQVSQCCFSTR